VSVTELPEKSADARVRGRATAGTGRGTRPLRVALGLVSLLSLAAGSLALALDLPGLRQPALLLFCAVGIGAAPWQRIPGIGGHERMALTLSQVSPS
jgi:hypothetical protein